MVADLRARVAITKVITVEHVYICVYCSNYWVHPKNFQDDLNYQIVLYGKLVKIGEKNYQMYVFIFELPIARVMGSEQMSIVIGAIFSCTERYMS